LKAMDVGLAGRYAYATAGRLDGIGQYPIGDMVLPRGDFECRDSAALPTLRIPLENYLPAGLLPASPT
jgi:hypothetical protein